MKTINEIYESYVSYIEMKLKSQSVRSIKSRFKNYILPYIGDLDIYSLSAFEYLKWQNTIEDFGFKYKYKKALHYSMVALYNFFNTFYDSNIRNIPKLVGNFNDNYDISDNINFFTYEEFKKFISFANEPVYHALFSFLFFSGCRIGEALALTFNDLNGNEIYINKTISRECVDGNRVINTPKTKKSIRRILIDEYIGSELGALKKHYSTQFDNFNSNFYIFGGNKPLSNTTVQRKKDKYCEIAGVKKIRIHDFRHSYATLLVNLNVPIEIISDQLGHSDINTTYNTYVHISSENKKRLIKSLEQLHS